MLRENLYVTLDYLEYPPPVDTFNNKTASKVKVLISSVASPDMLFASLRKQLALGPCACTGGEGLLHLLPQAKTGRAAKTS